MPVRLGDEDMTKRMTVVFHDEDLYTTLKVEAARRNKPASEIVDEAIREWLESREDAELLPVIKAARVEWREKGGRPWRVVEQELEEAMKGGEGRPEAKNAQT